MTRQFTELIMRDFQTNMQATDSFYRYRMRKLQGIKEGYKKKLHAPLARKFYDVRDFENDKRYFLAQKNSHSVYNMV